MRANAKLRGNNYKDTRGDVYESESELFGESCKVRRNVNVQLKEDERRSIWVRSIIRRFAGRGNLFRALWVLGYSVIVSSSESTTFTGDEKDTLRPAAHLLGNIGLALRSTMYHPCGKTEKER